ncbi:hypothetical protein QYF36_015532 [Acer negundo]|nr:hypothetical protein QYF36_015532 [Acer negundo]
MSPIDMGLLPHLTQTLELGACVPFKVLKSPHLDSKSPKSDDDLKALQTQSPITIEIVSGSCKTSVHLEGLDEKVPATPKDISTIAQADLDADSLNFNSSPPSPSPVVCSHLDVFYHLIHNKLGNPDDIFPNKLLHPNSCLFYNSFFNFTTSFSILSGH